jgi:hypothetical protein
MKPAVPLTPLLGELSLKDVRLGGGGEIRENETEAREEKRRERREEREEKREKRREGREEREDEGPDLISVRGDVALAPLHIGHIESASIGGHVLPSRLAAHFVSVGSTPASSAKVA